MKSKTKIEKQLKRKTGELAEIIIKLKKNKDWIPVASLISAPRRKRAELNLGKINNEISEGETVVIPGKVLSQGEIEKKARIVALAFSESAMKKIKDSKSEAVFILDEIKRNPEFKNIRILKNENN